MADEFVETIGVATHIPYTGGNYGNFNGVVKPRLAELGVRHIRDGIVPGGSQAGRDAFAVKLNALYQDHGIRTTVLFTKSDMSIVSNFLNAVHPVVAAVEGPNEPDLPQFGFIYNGNGWQNGQQVGQGWAVGARNYQTDLYNLVKNTPAFSQWPLVGMSMGWGGNSHQVGVFESHSNFGNFHWYMQLAYPPEHGGELNWLLNRAREIYPTQKLNPTEGGYPVGANGSGIHENAQGRYALRQLCEGFRRGFNRTFIYELIDENPSNTFGLLRGNNTPRPAFTGLKNLIALLADPGPNFQPGFLNYTVQDSSTSYPADSAGLRHFAVQKRDGSFYVVIWHAAKSAWGGSGAQISVADRSVAVQFGADMQQVQVFRPLQGGTALQTLSNVSSMTVAVPDHPVVLRLVPVPSAPEPGLVVLADVADAGISWSTWQGYPKDGGGNVGNSFAGTLEATLIKSGYRNANGNPAFCAVIPFQLPSVSTPATSVKLRLRAQPNTHGMWGIHDLYGLPARSTPTLQSSDLYIGPNDTTNATKLVAGIFNSSLTGLEEIEIDVTDFVNAQLASAGPGAYVFFRVNPAQQPPGGNGQFGVAIHSADAADPDARPALIFGGAGGGNTTAIDADVADTGLAWNTWQGYPKDGGGVLSSSFAGLVNGSLIRSGFRNANGNPSFCAVIPFLVPPGNTPVANATLRIYAQPNTNGMWGIHDLYGLPARTTATVQSGDFYIGPNDTTNATKIVAGLFDASLTSLQEVEVDVTAFVNVQIAAGAGGKFIFFRVNPAQQPPGGANGQFGVAIHSSDATDPSVRPTLLLRR